LIRNLHLDYDKTGNANDFPQYFNVSFDEFDQHFDLQFVKTFANENKSLAAAHDSYFIEQKSGKLVKSNLVTRPLWRNIRIILI
jgi:hypothetical protein